MSGIFKRIKKALRGKRSMDIEKRVREICALDLQDKERLQFYKQFIAAGDLVFDVGANMGNRTKLYLELGARVVAFEPQQQCADLLQHAFQANDRFTLLRDALGAQKGEAVMYVANAHTVSTLSHDWVRSTTETGRFEGVSWNERQTVAVTTLDAIISQHGVPRFIKIDVEGFEFEVLKGLSQPVDALSIEFATESMPVTHQAMEHMCELADMVFQIALGEELKFIGDGWMTHAQTLQKLQSLAEQDPMVWGDLYMKRA